MALHPALIGAVLISVIVNVATVNINAFDCRREGVDDCVQGTCGTSEKGACQCYSGYLSYDCSHDSSTSGSGCGRRCGDNAHCRSDNVCLCPETHYNGALGTCEYKTLQHKCSVNNKMLLNVNVPGVEELDVFVLDKEATCTLRSDGSTTHPAIPGDWRGKVVAVDMLDHTACGAPSVSNVDGKERRCVSIYMRYRSNLVSHLDKTVTFCCQDSQVDDLTALDTEVLTPKPPTQTTPSSAPGVEVQAVLLPVLLCIAVFGSSA